MAHEIILCPRNDKKIKLSVPSPNLYRGKACLELTHCNVHCKSLGYGKIHLKKKSEMWMKSKWVYLRHFKIQFWHISCYLEIARIHGAALLLGSVRVQAVWQSSSFLATGPPISQDSSFPPDSTGCWTGSRRTAHGRERPSDTNQRHWRGNCNVREGIWQVKPGINQALQTISLCMAVLYFQSFAVQLMSLKKDRTSA